MRNVVFTRIMQPRCILRSSFLARASMGVDTELTGKALKKVINFFLLHADELEVPLFT